MNCLIASSETFGFKTEETCCVVIFGVVEKNVTIKQISKPNQRIKHELSNSKKRYEQWLVIPSQMT
jgi:hypothetical protein